MLKYLCKVSSSFLFKIFMVKRLLHDNDNLEKVFLSFLSQMKSYNKRHVTFSMISFSLSSREKTCCFVVLHVHLVSVNLCCVLFLSCDDLITVSQFSNICLVFLRSRENFFSWLFNKNFKIPIRWETGWERWWWWRSRQWRHSSPSSQVEGERMFSLILLSNNSDSTSLQTTLYHFRKETSSD